MRTKSLQRGPPCSFEAFITTRTVAAVAEKVFAAAPCDDPRGPVSAVMVHVRPVASVPDDGCSVVAAFADRSPTAATVDGFSIATTAWPSFGIPHCSIAPLDAPVEISRRIPSTHTPGFAAVAIAAGPVALCVQVAFSVELTDLDWGSWEGSLPESSSLGGDRTPLRGAFIDSGFRRDSRTHCGENSISFGGLATFCRHQPAAVWSILVRRSGPFFRRRQHASALPNIRSGYN
jgi:hypothetical protein